MKSSLLQPVAHSLWTRSVLLGGLLLILGCGGGGFSEGDLKRVGYRRPKEEEPEKKRKRWRRKKTWR